MRSIENSSHDGSGGMARCDAFVGGRGEEGETVCEPQHLPLINMNIHRLSKLYTKFCKKLRFATDINLS